MIWLVLGLLLWSGAHLFKRLAPGARARMGDAGKGAVAIALVAAIVLMVVGYRAWIPSTVWWAGGPALTGINNLLVLVAFYLFAASGMKTWVARHYRHPQLTAVILWAVAHLLVNGDPPSVVLFGGLGLWAVAAILLIERAEPHWTPPAAPASRGREIGAVAGAVLVYGVVGLVHGWLGPWPFGGG
jgi:uncharacterized membrane protein